VRESRGGCGQQCDRERNRDRARGRRPLPDGPEALRDGRLAIGAIGSRCVAWKLYGRVEEQPLKGPRSLTVTTEVPEQAATL